MHRLVLASGNAGKLREFAGMLGPLGIEVVPQSQFNVPEAEEPHCTFLENALAKARHASRHCGLPALADDSGICVDALAGEPGVHSARYARAAADGLSQDERNNRKLIAALEGAEDRGAHYYCVLALVRHPEDPVPLIAEAAWHGVVVPEARGAGGFGYDPYFLLPELGLTAAELTAEHKNRVSHRGQALRLLVARLQAPRGTNPAD